jgi:hypothetical protein
MQVRDQPVAGGGDHDRTACHVHQRHAHDPGNGCHRQRLFVIAPALKYPKEPAPEQHLPDPPFNRGHGRTKVAFDQPILQRVIGKAAAQPQMVLHLLHRQGRRGHRGLFGQ